MQDDVDLKNIAASKKKLLSVLGTLIHNERLKRNKGINTFSFEYDIGNGLLSKLEKGNADTKITTVWKLADAFGYKCSDFIKLVEDNLPEDFNFYE